MIVFSLVLKNDSLVNYIIVGSRDDSCEYSRESNIREWKMAT